MFGFFVNVNGIICVFRGIGCVVLIIENKIGWNMNYVNVVVCISFCKIGDSFMIDCVCCFNIGFCFIYGGVSSGVDNEIRL